MSEEDEKWFKEQVRLGIETFDAMERKREKYSNGLLKTKFKFFINWVKEKLNASRWKN